ncbi:MAG: PDGLE domain-containing protein [Desulfobacterota bacterium]|nr:PDGLE domain-containing protein [Thermodesulfobacteriota bacterium]
MKITTKFWIALVVLVILSPVGLILPEYFKAGSAWGEWGVEEIEGLVGYIPSGLKKLAEIWNAPIPDYAFKGWEEKSLTHLSFAYIISAILGIVVVILLIFLLGKFFTKRNE